MDTKKILIVIAIVLGLVVVIASYSLMNTSVTPEFENDLPAIDEDFLPDMDDEEEVEDDDDEEEEVEEVEDDEDDEEEE